MNLNEIELHTWEDFEAEITSLLDTVRKKRAEAKMYVSRPLFRGHANASWKLDTTLERCTSQQYSMRDYYNLIGGVRPAVESYTEKHWNLSEEYSIDESIPGPPLGYDFMIYLRHHGFPSPLLDWTRSPYVAAYFAFRTEGPAQDDSVAIYSYIEYYGHAHTWDLDRAAIFVSGPYVITHKRHYTQQCEYTICKKRVDDNYVYANHEDAIVTDNVQGSLRKYILPKKERVKALGKLNVMNISAYSLFGNEESLMETLAYQEITQRMPEA
jgi:hypothetical protein